MTGGFFYGEIQASANKKAVRKCKRLVEDIGIEPTTFRLPV